MIRFISILFMATVFTTACGAKFTSTKGSAPAPAINPNLPPPVQQGYPTAVSPVVDNYPAPQYDPYTALNGSGRWEVIDGQRFFVPDLSQSRDREGWEPYQNGYWAYDTDRDWTWVSSDRWGSITDHYGIWRHHKFHGWIWMPFADNHYEPHCVTWFNEGEYVGWYPYHSAYESAYRRFGAKLNFDDGYWDGYRAVLSLNGSGFGFRIGITMVERAYVTQPNIRARMIRDRSRILNTVRVAHSDDRIRRGLVGRIPGGDHRTSHRFLQDMAPHQIAPVGRAREVVAAGGARIMQPAFERREQRRKERRSDGRDSRRRDRRASDDSRDNNGSFK